VPDVPRGRWQLLGELLQARRQELGFRSLTAFARERLAPTDSGNTNSRLVRDLENAYRDTFPTGTLRFLARAYEVTYESVLAVLRGEADALSSADPLPSPSAPAGDSRRTPPVAGEDYAAASWPYAEPIWERLYDLARAGNTDPRGADLFGDGTDDARTWDDPRQQRLLSLRERVRYIADLRRREAGGP
jgi:hypothetical protein